MAEKKCTEVESAIDTLVTEFHKAANDGATMSSAGLANLVSSQLSNRVKNSGDPAGMAALMKQLNIKDSEGITFQEFWGLIKQLATAEHEQSYKQKKLVECRCRLV
ncbi:S100 calcium binding protein V2 [Polyodon spathula]|uniref:S100 calcium binding protein V2 n=1 Tax=Polyodon spathula TaxID=7913 RepID=UPI001B7ECA6B|nr:S100 calcium binding protein V2 [Polyodon spathula]